MDPAGAVTVSFIYRFQRHGGYRDLEKRTREMQRIDRLVNQNPSVYSRVIIRNKRINEHKIRLCRSFCLVATSRRPNKKKESFAESDNNRSLTRYPCLRLAKNSETSLKLLLIFCLSRLSIWDAFKIPRRLLLINACSVV